MAGAGVLPLVTAPTIANIKLHHMLIDEGAGLNVISYAAAVGGYPYLYVAIDKFTKWPEATPMVNITKASAIAFPKSIVCRSNGQVERANAEILTGLKIRTYNDLEKHGAKWVDQLPSILWGNRTTPSRAIEETPFFLVYGAEACHPPEITMGSLRVQAFDEGLQERQHCQDVDLVDE
ncbi:uncharacterized protein LOC112896438 [Panicum hallii]|uniref:uncharacterized protein LOC112896438 n=1 Tax=Panicum hallii TaxID=206008 RepID=UPI000DF4F0F4|nr:uncharacterized protein LOC112896438 [Panicum hallii]